MSAKLRIYLDDCADDNALAEHLRQAGHTVCNPRLAGTRGVPDRQHLEWVRGGCGDGLTTD